MNHLQPRRQYRQIGESIQGNEPVIGNFVFIDFDGLKDFFGSTCE